MITRSETFFSIPVKIPSSWNDEVSSLRVIKGVAWPSLSTYSPASLSPLIHSLCSSLLLHSVDLFSTSIVWSELCVFSHRCCCCQEGNQQCPPSWRHFCFSQSLSASPEPSVSFFFPHHVCKWQHFILICLFFSYEWQQRSLTNLFLLVFSSDHSSQRCLCSRTRGLRGITMTEVKDLHVYPQTVFCSKVEIV